MSTAPSAAPHVARILEVARALGATVTETIVAGCYNSRCSYGTPNYVGDGVPVENEVKLHTCTWPTAPRNPAEPWYKFPTGPTMVDIVVALGINGSWQPDAKPHDHARLVKVLVYEHGPTLEKNGDRGDGVVLATAQAWAQIDWTAHRQIHLVTNPAGELEIGMFG